MLTIVSTPIGNPDDITLRALSVLKSADAVIGEEHRVTSTVLKRLGVPQKEIYLLNEHTKKQDLDELIELCKTQNVALISDCGTPVFCDPGAVLIRRLRQLEIPVQSAPGASSLMTLLSLSSRPLNQFYFAGFPPAEKTERKQVFIELQKHKCPIVLMDTPYRLQKVFEDLEEGFKQREVLVGLNLTAPNELILEGHLTNVKKRLPEGSHEFILIVYF